MLLLVKVHTFVGVSIGFDPVSYEVQEADGTVSFDIVKIGQNDLLVTVKFSTVDRTAIGMGSYIVARTYSSGGKLLFNLWVCCFPLSTVAGNDYDGITSQTVTFDTSTDRQTVAVDVINDDIHEALETFMGSLTRTNLNIELFNETATATIIDDDSK